jgi:hypothetical protein
LTTGVDQIVDRLNSLPNADEFLARMREQERKAGHDANNLELGCTLIGFATEFSLALRYPDGSIAVVWLYQNCGTASSGGRTRYGDVRNLFLTLYRGQLEATANPASVQAPTCPSHLTRADLTMAPGGKHPLDEIARNRSGENPFLPSPLAKANVCRYHKASGGSATLVKSDAVSDPERLRTMLNAATTVQTTTDERGASSATNFADCFGADLGIADVLDLLRIADITGAIAELFILRGPCAAVVRYSMGGLVPTPELTAALDARLGRP